MAKIVFIRTNNLTSETRLLKERQAAASDYSTALILWDRPGSGETAPAATYFRLKAPYGRLILLLYLPIWFGFVVIQLFKLKPDLIHACDWEGYVPAAIYRFFCPVPVVFDLWDALIGRFPVSALSSLLTGLDRAAAHRASAFIVPDPERLEQIGLDPTLLSQSATVIYNSDEVTTKARNVHFSGPITITYVGVMSAQIRGLEQLIEAARALPSCQFVIAGYGRDEAVLKALFSEAGLTNLKFVGRVSHTEAEKLNQQSDLMVSLLDPSYGNYRYATSTKVFEAFKFGKPVITTEGTASGQLISTTGWGVAVPYTAKALIATIQDITSGKVTFQLDPSRVQPYSWSVMTERLVKLYQQLLTQP